jgi:hypothetical protein
MIINGHGNHEEVVFINISLFEKSSKKFNISHFTANKMLEYEIIKTKIKIKNEQKIIFL